MGHGLADAIVLSDAERSFLESQVRRHKAPRSLSDRCRIVFLCAEGLKEQFRCRACWRA